MQAGKSLDKALIYLGGEETPLSQLPEKDVRARLDTLRSAQFRTQAVEAVAMPLKRLSSLFLGQPEPVEPEVSMQQAGFPLRSYLHPCRYPCPSPQPYPSPSPGARALSAADGGGRAAE